MFYSFNKEYRGDRSGQNLLEYTIILSVVITIFITLNPLIKRTVQGMIRTAADQIGNQEGAEQEFNEVDGYTIQLIQTSDSHTRKNIKEGRSTGITDIFYDDYSSTYSVTNSFLGHRPEN